ncbi:EamA family transporter [Candidatus Poribacteria bacterium]|nr:EamA family transporter [Candidatus Poribacteria bacterium]
MIALLLHILFSTAFGLIVKDSQVRGRNLWAVGTVNYIIAAIGASIYLVRLGMAAPNFAPYQFSQPTLIVGVLAGVGYVVSYFFLLAVVKQDGISVTMAVVRLSVMIPVVFSIFYWREQPNLSQISGIILVCLSLPLLSQNRPPRQTMKSKPLTRVKGNFQHAKFLILVLFLLTGWCALSTKAFVQVSPPDAREIFLLFLFGTAAVIGIVPLLLFRMVPTPRDILPGTLLGLCNIFGNHFLLIALSGLPGMIVFPIASSSGVVLNTLFAVTVWHERLRRPVIVGIAISVLALVLINLK